MQSTTRDTTAAGIAKLKVAPAQHQARKKNNKRLSK